MHENSRMRETILARFAHAIARHGCNAMLLSSDNKCDGFVPIEEAIRCGRAFSVEVESQILPIDCDDPALKDDVASLASDLEALGVTPVVLASGQPGRLHLFARIQDPAIRSAFEARARRERMDVRRSIRPPLAPHRLGLVPRLIRPMAVEDAVAALEPSG